MDFDFDSEQRMVQEQTSRFLAEHCTPAVVRAVLDGDRDAATPVWKGLVEMGLPGTAIPEAAGGVGAGHLPLCLVAEELGAALAPTPFGATVYLLAEAVMLAGSDAQKEQLLPAIAEGRLTGCLAVVESTVATTANNLTTRAADETLTGTKIIVPDGTTADVAIVLAAEAAGPSLFLATLADATVTRTPVESVDPTIATARIDFDATPAERLGAAGAGWELLQAIQDRAAVLYAFEQLGGARSSLDMAVAYANERFAFGRPIGSFQALKHMMADMYVALKLAESNCYYAAWALTTGSSDLTLAAATARVSATQAFQRCSKDNIQVHGGMGFTWEFDCHLYYRRSNFLALAIGGLRHWEDRLVDHLHTNAAA